MSPPNLSASLIPILRSPSPKVEPHTLEKDAALLEAYDIYLDSAQPPSKELVRTWRKLTSDPPTSAATPDRWQTSLRQPAVKMTPPRQQQQKLTQQTQQTQRHHHHYRIHTPMSAASGQQQFALRKTPMAKLAKGSQTSSTPPAAASADTRPSPMRKGSSLALPKRAPPKMDYEPGSWRGWWRTARRGGEQSSAASTRLADSDSTSPHAVSDTSSTAAWEELK